MENFVCFDKSSPRLATQFYRAFLLKNLEILKANHDAGRGKYFNNGSPPLACIFRRRLTKYKCEVDFFYINTNTMLFTSMGNPISQSLLTKPKMFWLTEKVFCISDIMWIALVDEFFCKQDLLCTMLFFWHIFLALFSKVSAADGKSLRRALQKARKELWKC